MQDQPEVNPWAPPPLSAEDEAFARIMVLLDRATEAVRKGNYQGAAGALKEATATAKTLPTKIIVLPDRSGERLP